MENDKSVLYTRSTTMGYFMIVCILLYTSYVLLSMLLRVEYDFGRGVGIITVKNQCHPVSCIFFCTQKYINISTL